MRALKISEDLRPLSDMKAKPNDVVTQARESGRPVVLTRYGKGVAVLMSVESYEELQVSSARLRLIAALREAEKAIEEGDVYEQKDMTDLFGRLEEEG
ncbi:MAG: type II toxin-antitoxin system Phd/YefM family antitoxin [Deltaproteobacteria bacterium]|nr:type II toxin-antitoxin system Phd/YefM family antitoxin [Deltaproteobacteria bacterium]